MPQTPQPTDAQRRHDTTLRGFASDNYAGMHPEVLEALALANGGHQTSYGEDAYSEHLQDIFKQHFGPQAHTHLVLNGTGANVVALQAVTDRWGAVIAADTSHINCDENGAPERVGGLKLLTVPGENGKLTPELIDRQAWGFGDPHRAQPQVVSITQTTELGTCYTPEEIAAICDRAHEHGLRVHLDGARLANAAATLGLPLHAFTTDVGVDILTFGGTKNGLMLAEAIVVLNPTATRGLEFLHKASMQLPSKTRFLAVQFEALLAGDLWLRSANHANALAKRLSDAVNAYEQVEVLYPVQANAVFATLPKAVTERLQKRFRFYTWDENTGAVRWMTAFDTTEADIDAFSAAIGEELAAQ
ncbi:MAG: low specificity L-threonine aldolase [Corynebacteriales bacterium]|nr:low specificity L-threonine aldolase [Mycobacteriales bacterium]